MKLSDSLELMELSDVALQYELDKDLPLCLRNLLAALDNQKSPKYQVKKLWGISLYQPSNKNLPYNKWWKLEDITHILMSITEKDSSECNTEIFRASVYYPKSVMNVHKQNFWISRTKQVMICTCADIDSYTGRRQLFRRHPISHNIVMTEESVVKQELIQLCELKEVI